MNETNDPEVKLASQVIPDDLPAEGVVEVPQVPAEPVPEQEIAPEIEQEMVEMASAMFPVEGEEQVASLGRLGRIFKGTDNMARVRKHAQERPRAEDAQPGGEMPGGEAPGAEPLGTGTPTPYGAYPEQPTNEQMMEVGRDALMGTAVDPARNEFRNYSLDYIDTPEEVEAVINSVPQAWKMHGSAPPRVSHAQTVAEAEAEFDMNVTLGSIIGGPPDAALNRKQQLNGRRALAMLGTDVYEQLSGAVVTNPRTGELMFRDGLTIEEKLRAKKRLHLLAAFNYRLQGRIKETARALNAMQIPVSADPVMQTVINKEFYEAVTTEKELLGFAKLVIETKGDMTKLNEVARKSVTATGWDMIMEVWYNSVLSGTGTHMVNGISNALIPSYLILEDTVAATVSHGRRALQKLWYASQHKDVPASQEQFLSYSSVGAQAVGLNIGYIDAFRMLHHFWKASEGGSMVDPANIKVDQVRVPAITGENATKLFGGVPGPLTDNMYMRTLTDLSGVTVRIPSRFLTTSDDFFKVANYSAAVYEMAVNDAVNRAAKGEYAVGSEEYYQDIERAVRLPTTRIHAYAVQREKLATFTNELTDRPSQMIHQFVTNVPAFKPLVPFVRVSTNLFKYAGNRTPLPFGVDAFNVMFRSGYGKEVSRTQTFNDMFGKDPIARDRAMARIGIGTSATLALWSLMNTENENGDTVPFITGSGPTDPARRRMWMKAGWQPYSVFINGKYYSYDRYDPFSIFIGSIATANELMNDTYNENERMNIAAAVIFGMADTLTDKTYMQNVGSLIEFINNPKTAGTNPMRNFLSGFMPTFFAEMRRSSTLGIDPYKRQRRTKPQVKDARYDQMDMFGQFWTDLTNAFKDRTPGWSKDMPYDLNWAGKPVLGAKDVGFYRFPPTFYTEPDLNALTSELLHKGFTFNDQYTERSSWTIFKGEAGEPAGTYDTLLDDESGQLFHEYRIMIGSAFESELRKAVSDKSYREADKALQYEMIASAAGRARKIGRTAFNQKHRKRIDAFLKQYYGVGETTPGAYPPHQGEVPPLTPPGM